MIVLCAKKEVKKTVCTFLLGSRDRGDKQLKRAHDEVQEKQMTGEAKLMDVNHQ